MQHWYDAWNFLSSCLLATFQWCNTLAGATVVFMLSFKRRHGRITFHVFCSCDCDLNPMTFIYELDPYALKSLSKVIVWRTDRQTDTTEIITIAALQVIINTIIKLIISIIQTNTDKIKLRWSFLKKNKTQTN